MLGSQLKPKRFVAALLLLQPKASKGHAGTTQGNCHVGITTVTDLGGHEEAAAITY